MKVGLGTLVEDHSRFAELVRKEFSLCFVPATESHEVNQSAHADMHRAALNAAREAVFAMRRNDEIGDDAFHAKEELDWHETARGG